MFKASLLYIGSSGAARATQRHPASDKQTNPQQQQKKKYELVFIPSTQETETDAGGIALSVPAPG